jgi:hypothetical protein
MIHKRVVDDAIDAAVQCNGRVPQSHEVCLHPDVPDDECRLALVCRVQLG